MDNVLIPKLKKVTDQHVKESGWSREQAKFYFEKWVNIFNLTTIKNKLGRAIITQLKLWSKMIKTDFSDFKRKVKTNIKLVLYC
jgi:hypothetical protein